MSAPYRLQIETPLNDGSALVRVLAHNGEIVLSFSASREELIAMTEESARATGQILPALFFRPGAAIKASEPRVMDISITWVEK